MKIDVKENLIELERRDSVVIDDELNKFLDKDKGQNIKADIELLNNMGFDKKMINKVYILLRPENIERAIDYMTELDGIYQHNFISNNNPNEKSLCFICKNPKNKHLDFIPDDLLNDIDLNNNINNNKDKIVLDQDKDAENGNNDECEVCYDNIEDKKLNAIPCGHLFCTHCWFNYLKTLITEAKVEKIKCMNHECKEEISEEFILKHLSENKKLIEKYRKFKKRAEILQDKNKKLCPKPDCDSFLQKSNKSRYVKCEHGHEYCFDCLRPPHGKNSCDNNLEKQLVKWTKGKRVKRCPRCKIYTEKNEGCNHMTCVSCKYQWCWLCEGEYKYGHYESGKCQGQQFIKADLPQKVKKNNNNSYRNSTPCDFGLHKIFRCVCQERVIPYYYLDDMGAKKYLLMIGFWLFGFIYNFFELVNYNFNRFTVKNEKTKYFLDVIMIFTGIVIGVPYQIAFTCLATPFFLICLIHHQFYELFLAFFGIGSQNEIR